MATSYTTLLGLALPVQGELQGTWGDEVNNYITNYLDAAVAGTQNISTDADVTLTKTTGTALTGTSSQYSILLFSGSRAAQRTVTVPAASKSYVVINATTGGFAVKVVGVGPTTGVTIANGEKAVIAWNGSDFIKVSTFGGDPTFGNVTVTGTTTLSGLTASTALALNASKEVVSVTNTGTGNNVLSASPTLTGTLTAAAANFSGAVALNGNSTLGDAVGDTVTVNGATTFVNAAPILTPLSASQAVFTDGSKKLVSNAITGTGNVVMSASPTLTGTLAAAAATFSGNVTLGDASTDTVTVNGRMGIGGAAATTAGFYLTNSALVGSQQHGVFSNITGASDATAQINAFVSTPATAASAYTSTLVSGYQARDAVKGAGSTITNQHGLYIADQTQGTNNYGITSLVSSGANKWNIYASGTAANYFAGNVGIGTNSPSELLTVGAGTASVNSVLYLNGGSDSTKGAGIKLAKAGTAFAFIGSVSWLLGGTSSNLGFSANSSATNVMQLDSSGNLGLGVTPSAWATLKGFEIGTAGSGFTANGAADLQHLSNAYYNAGWKYASTNNATRYSQSAGAHAWFTAPSGTAGNAITFTERTKITATEMVVNEPGEDYDFRVESDTNTHALFVQGSDGFVGIGTSSPQSKLHLSGATPTSTTVLQLGGDSTSTGVVLEFSGSANAFLWNKYNGYLSLGTNNTERLRIDSSGNVGIGTSSPTATGNYRVTEIKSADTTSGGMLILGTSNNSGVGRLYSTSTQILLDDSSSTSDIYVKTNGANNLLFGTNNTERLRITSDGYLRMASGSLGIQFNGDTAAANALDDYEEGTFSAVIEGTTTAGSGTYSVQQAKYTKIGNLVTVAISLVWSAHTGTGNMQIAGLPFTSAANQNPVAAVYANNLTVTGKVTATVQALQTIMSLFAENNGASTSIAMDTAGTIILSVSYFV